MNTKMNTAQLRKLIREAVEDGPFNDRGEEIDSDEHFDIVEESSVIGRNLLELLDSYDLLMALDRIAGTTEEDEGASSLEEAQALLTHLKMLKTALEFLSSTGWMS